MNNAGPSTFNGVIAGAGSVTKTGAGTLTLGGANVYTGATNILAGTVNTTVSNALAPNSTLTVSGATVNLFDNPAAVTTVNVVDLTAASGIVNTGQGVLAVKSQLRQSDNGILNYTPGGAATAFQVKAASVGNGASSRTITIPGGTLTPGLGVPVTWNGGVMSVTASTFYAPDDRSPGRVVDRSGMAGAAPGGAVSTDVPGGNMWLTNNASTGQWIRFDFGSSLGLSKVHIWNYGEAGTFLGRGVKDVVIQSSTDGVNFTSVLTTTFTQGTGIGDTGADVVFPALINTRYLRFLVQSNYNNDASYTGLSEVQFYQSTLATPNTDYNLSGNTSTLDLTNVVGNIGTLTGVTGSSIPTTNGGLIVGGTGSTTFSGIISGGGSFTKTGASTLTLGAANTYTGGTRITGGVLNTSVSNALGNNTQLTISGATLNLFDNPAAVTTVSIADLTSASGIVNTGQGVLAVTSQLKQPDGTTLNYTAGGAATAFHVNGSNVGSDTAGRIITIPGGTLTPAAGTPLIWNGGVMTATASTFYAPDDRSAGHVVDRSGMGGTAPGGFVSTVAPGGNMWLTNGLSTGQWIRFDFGSVVPLSRVHIWNYDEAGAFLGRGIKDAVFQSSTDGVNFTDVQNATFPQGTGLNDVGFDLTFTSLINTRYLRILVSTNHNNDASYTGLSEIQFFQSTLSAPNTTFHLGSNTAVLNLTDVGATVNTVTGVAGGSIVTTGGGLTVSGSGTSSFGGTITGGGYFTKAGSGTFTLAAANTYTGDTTVSGGILATSANNALGVGSRLIVSGATLNLWDNPAAVSTVNIADLTSATGIVNTGQGVLAISSQLRQPDGTVLNYTAGGPSTAFQVNGTNIGSDTAGRTIIVPGGTLAPAGSAPLMWNGGTMSVSASSFYAPDDRSAGHVVDRSGMGGTAPGGFVSNTAPGGTMWLTNNAMAGQWIRFDFGAIVPLSKMHIWNYDETPAGFFGRGIKDAMIQTSTDGVVFTDVQAATFAQGTGLNDVGADVVFSSLINTRYLRILVVSNYNNDGSYTGLSEVQFYQNSLALPNTTVNLSGNTAVLNLANVGATIGGLTGVAGSTVATSGGALTVAGGAGTTFSGAIAGTGSFTKSGAGTFTLAGTSTYTGATNVIGGVLNTGANNALGNTSLLTVTGATLNLFDSPAAVTTVGVADLSSATGIVNTGQGVLVVNSQLKQTDLATLNYVPGGAATAFHVNGSNIGSDTVGRTVIVPGGTLTPVSSSPLLWNPGTMSVTASSFYNGDDRSPGHVVDRTGMSGTAPGGTTTNTAPGGTMWLTNGVTAGEWIRFDFGAIVGLGRVHIWNYDELPANFLDRGLKDVNIQTSTDGVAFTTVETGVFQKATGSNDPGSDYFFASPIATRYLRFQIVTSYNTGGDTYAGLAEVQFYQNVFSVPNTTFNVSASGAALNLSGAASTIGGLAGAAGSSVNINNASLVVAGTGTTTFAGVMSGAGSFTKAGTSTLTLLGANTYTGDTLIQSGTLNTGVSNALGNSTTTKLTVAATGTLNLWNDAAAVTTFGNADLSAGGVVNTGAGNLVLSTFVNLPGGVVMTFAPGGGATTFALNGADAASNSVPRTFTLTGGTLTPTVPSLATHLAWNGGTMSVTASSFYSPDDRSPGHVVDRSGMSGAAPGGTVTNTNPGGTMWLTNGVVAGQWIRFDFGAVVSLSKVHIWNYDELPAQFLDRSLKDVDIQTSTDGVNFTTAQAAVFQKATGAGDPGSDVVFTFPLATRYLRFLVNTTYGSGADPYAGLAEVQFYTQPPLLNLPETTFALNAAGAVFNAAAFSLTTVGSLAGIGAVPLPPGATLTFAGSASGMYMTPITGTTTVVRTGTGTQTLGGANTYSGTTTINQGTLRINGSLANGPAATDVVVNTGGVLGGSGSIAGIVHVNGGTIAPGNSVGTLSTATTDFVAGSTFHVEVIGNSADLLSVTGTVTLGNAILLVDPASTPISPHAPYTIIDNDGGDAVSGLFTTDGVTPLTEGAQVGEFNNVRLLITYIGGDGNDVQLVVASDTINGTPGNDTLVVRQQDATHVELSYNGAPFFAFDSSQVFTFNGLGGTDQILIDLDTAFTFNGHLMFDGESIRVEGPGAASFQPQDVNKLHAASGFLNYAGSPSIDFVGLTSAGITATSGAFTLQNGATTSVGGTFPVGYSVAAQPALTAIGAGISVRFAGNGLSSIATGSGDTITVAAAGATSDGPLELTGGAIGGTGVLAGTSLDASAVDGISLSTNITSLAAQTFGLTGDVVITEADAIDLTDIETFGGSVSVSAGGNINVSYVAALDSSVTLQVTGAAGSILDLDDDPDADIEAAFGITLVAKGTGTIGVSTNALELGSYGVGIIDALSAQTDNSNIYLGVPVGDVRILKLNAVAGGGLVPAGSSGDIALTTDGNVFMDSDAFGGGADIVGNLVTLTATGDLGANANPLELNAVTLATSTISGGLLDSAQFLAEADSVAIGSNGLNPGNASVNLERLGGGTAIYNFSSGDSINDVARLNLADGVQVVLNNDETVGALGDYPGHVATAGFAEVLFAGRKLTVGANGNDTSYSGILTGANGQLVKTGVGRLTEIDAGFNTYSGLTTVENGALVLAKTGGGNKAIVGSIMIGDSVGATGSATLEIGASEQIADAAAIQFTGIDGRLLSTAGTTETITTPTDFAGGDVKVAGLLITTNAYDQPTGTTTLNGGTLRVGAAGTLNSSLGTSATPGGTLQGSGTIYTNILTSWGTIDPSSGVTDLDVGNRSPGRITIRGNLQMTASSTTNLDVAPTGSDQLNVGINPALALPAGSYTNLSNYDLDPYLRGDVAVVTEQARRGVNDLYSINGTVRLNGTLNTRPIQGSSLTNNVTYGNAMNFVWRALNLPMGGFWGDLNPKGGNLSSVPSDFATRNSLDVNGLQTAAMRFDPRFMGSGGQFNAVGQSVGFVTKVMGNDQAGLTAPAYSVGQAKGLTLTSLTSSATVDTTAVKVTKQLWNAMKDSHTRVTLTITNTSAAAATGPIYVELVGVPAGATVFNAAGKRPSTGKPYLVVPAASLAAGAAVTMEVDLLTPVTLGKTAALTTQVLRGGMP